MRLNQVLLLAIVAMIPAAFLATRPGFQNAALIYTILFLIIGAAYFFKIIPNLPQAIMLMPGLIWGIGMGAAFIFLNTLNKDITIGNPFTLADNLLVTVGVAPILETLFFAIVIMGIYTALFRNFYIALVLQAATFALFHFTVYGASLATVTTPFIGAFIFGLAHVILLRVSKSITAPIIAHSIFNFYLVRSFAIGVGL